MSWHGARTLISSEYYGVLRPLRGGDLETVRAWRNHPSVREFMYSKHTIDRAEHERWFERTMADPDTHLLIFERNQVPSGFLNVSVADKISRRATWGFYLAPTASRGSGYQLGMHALTFVFADLKMHKLWGEVLISNERSIHFHQRLGFHREALLRDHYFDGSQYHDVLGFGLLANEWATGSGRTE